MTDHLQAETSTLDKVIAMIERVGKLSGLRPDQDVYVAGFSSIRTLELLIEIEDEFAVAVPDDGSFPAARTANAIHDLVCALRR